MPPETTRHSCPDCGTSLTPIRIVDQLGQGGLTEGLAFTHTAKPKTSAWTGKVKNADGVINGYLCPTCSRVPLYAEPAR